MSKTIVITGAGSGLGRAVALRFAADGWATVLLGRTLEKLQGAADEIGEAATAIACDIREPDSVRAAFAEIAARFPQIDMLVNNAAFVEHQTIAEASDRHILEGVGTNLIGHILCSRAAIPLLRRGGHIVNISSGAVENNFGGMSVYAATKAGLERFSRSLYEELEPQGVCVSYLRTGQMVDDLERWRTDPAIAETVAAALAHGLDPRKRPSATFASVAGVLAAMTRLPPDLAAAGVVVKPRRQA